MLARIGFYSLAGFRIKARVWFPGSIGSSLKNIINLGILFMILGSGIFLYSDIEDFISNPYKLGEGREGGCREENILG